MWSLIVAARSDRKERFNDKLREAYVEYWKGVELVERLTIKLVGEVELGREADEPFDEDKFQERAEARFDSRAPYSIASALDRVETINDHIRAVINVKEHSFNLGKAKVLADHTDKLLNALTDAIRDEHPRLAVPHKLRNLWNRLPWTPSPNARESDNLPDAPTPGRTDLRVAER